MHWWLLRAQSETEAAFEDTVDKLSKDLEKGKASLWEEHNKVSKLVASQSGENVDPQQQQPEKEPTSKPSTWQLKKPTISKTTSTEESVSGNASTNSSSEPSLPSNTISVEIIQGEYLGSSYLLKPTARQFAWVGRSQGKKFREKGISLPKDLEVSTTHGKFEIRRGKFIYLDEGSTNGSMVNGERIEPKVAVELETGTEILVGQTVMKITLPN